MAKDNLTAVLHGVEDLRLEQKPIPTIRDDEVLLEMDCVGICGSDVHYLVHGGIGPFILKEPMIIGHEAAGIVAKVGKSVKNLKVGDRVAIEPGVSCRMCHFCKEGRYNLCPDMVFCATPPCHGNLTKFYAHAADFCFKLPDHVTMEEGALLEPLSVGVHACRRGDIGVGSEVLILGAGPIGLVTLLAAKAMGASKILITDLLPKRLSMAKELGADFTYVIEKDVSEEENVKRIHAVMGSEPNKTIDCSGVQATNRLAMLSTRSGGCVVVVGNGPQNVSLPLVYSCNREIDIRGVFRYCNDYPTALALVASGKIPGIRKLVTHHFDITETAKAFETSRYALGDAIKVMIHCQKRDQNNSIKFQ
ncbi:sorbitol dehydrogenase [Sergentomyia squamirostris]